MNKKIIVHSSASPWGNALVIDQWHRERGWRGIGYHAVILNGFPHTSYWCTDRRIKIYNGVIEPGRALDADNDIDSWEQGAHAYGYNENTVSVCLIGGEYTSVGETKFEDFTKNQIISLVKLVKLWQFQFRISTENVLGHSELPGVTKSCPCLQMEKIRLLVDNKTESIRLFKTLDGVKEVH